MTFLPYLQIVMIAAALSTVNTAPAAQAQTATPEMLRSCNDAVIDSTVHEVISVLDAHTLKLDNGRELRLASVLPPFPPPNNAPGPFQTRQTHPTWQPLQQTEDALRKLTTGRSVQLAFGRQKTDRYGRYMAQLFVLPEDAAGMRGRQWPTDRGIIDGKDRLWVQAWLVAKGLARAYDLTGAENCLSGLLEYEREARASKTGLWSHAAYRIRDATKSGELSSLIGSYQVVEGRILWQGGSRNRIYLNFGENWRRDFTVGIDRQHSRAFEKAGLPLRHLKGRRISVRGWVERRGGPYIQASMASQIEFLPD